MSNKFQHPKKNKFRLGWSRKKPGWVILNEVKDLIECIDRIRFFVPPRRDSE